MSIAEKLPPVLSTLSLVAPISEEHPCGSSREHGEDIDLGLAYGQIRDDFDMAKRIERARSEMEMLASKDRQEMVAAFKDRPDSPNETPRWDRIISQSELVLTSHSKDMRIVSWLTEAACRVHGLIGLRDAFDLCLALIEKYGEQLYPSASNDNLSYLRPIRNLNTSPSLMVAIKQTTFVQGKRCHFEGYELAKYIHTLSVDKQEEMRGQGKLIQDDFSAIVRECEPEEIDSYSQQLDEALASAKMLDAAMLMLSEKEHQAKAAAKKLANPSDKEAQTKASDKELLSISKLIELLEQVRAWFKALCEERPNEEPAKAESPSVVTPVAAPVSGVVTQAAPVVDPVAVAIRAREDALSQLTRVAKFFRASEPHSPLSYALEQAVRWGKMGLPELLKEVVNNEVTLKDMYRLVGIQEKEEK